MFFRKWHLLMAEMDPTPSFTDVAPGTPEENPGDEEIILNDQDQTNMDDPLTKDDRMGAISNSLDTLEDEPADFMRGEIDVKDQMDRAASALDDSIHGYERQSDEDNPQGDLGASFRDTPGGLEEVEQKTEEDLAQHKGFRKETNSTPSPKHPKH